MKKEIYLKDKQFLKNLDNENIKTLTAKITILDWDEKPIIDFTGRVLPGGTVNLDGNSSMRRTCNISLFLEEDEINITKIENLISLNKKIKLEIGVYNTLEQYQEYDIIWFPLGIYVIIQPNISRSTSGTTVSLQLKDKMCLLNGEIAGTLPASITFNEMGYTDNDGNEFIENPTIFQIITELVNHWGGEQLGNIIISDLDTRIKKVMKWNSENYPAYYKEMNNEQILSYSYKTEVEYYALPPEEREGYKECSYGDDLGFVYTDFIWPGDDLIGDIGSTVCDILDKITSVLGNFEYFYDVYGKFHFQEKKNYLNTTQATTFLRQLEKRQTQDTTNNYLSLITKEDYQIDLSNGKSEYKFDSNNLITSYANIPQFTMIKNDFLVWGLRKTADDTTLPIRYHLAIDKKPDVGIVRMVVLYKDEDGLIKAASVEDRQTKTGEYKLGHFYCDSKKSKVMFIDQNIRKFAYTDNGVVYISLLGLDSTLYKYDFVVENGTKTKTKDFIKVEQKEGEIYLAAIISNDWRTELYLQGIEAEANGVDSNYYYPELLNEWPKLFDLEKNKFREEVLKDPSGIDYFLDFIDSNSAIGEFSVNNIGRRSYAITDDKVNCVFSIDPVDCIILQQGESVQECADRGQRYSSVSDDFYKNLIQGGTQNSAYVKIRELLYQYTSYCENITLQSIPVYYLDINTRVTVQDPKSNIFGDYFINRITLPLDCTGMMSISATRALERI